jgi:DNA-binding CsgD family transcriptional regulator
MENFSEMAEFVVLCENAQNVQTIAVALFAIAERAGFTQTTYQCGVSVFETGLGLRLTNHTPAWRERYRSNAYHRIDPILAHANHANAPFLWSDPRLQASMTQKQKRMLCDAAAHGVGHGYAVPLQGSLHASASCLFACAVDDIAPTACATMRIAALIAHEHLCRLVRRTQTAGRPLQLSPQERACLNRHAQGQRDRQIADALGIRIPTVRRHLDQAQDRLGVESRQEAIIGGVVTWQIELGPRFGLVAIDDPIARL